MGFYRGAPLEKRFLGVGMENATADMYYPQPYKDNGASDILLPYNVELKNVMGREFFWHTMN